MSMRTILRRFVEMMENPFFAEYEKDFSRRLCSALANGYRQSYDEPELVEQMVTSVNSISLSDPTKPLGISTSGVFIHGNKSQVSFDYYGKTVYRELGDLIFIISIVFNGKKYFEKFTINQCKKDKSGSRKITWSLYNKEQLYLLSRFPTFTGSVGLISKVEHSLENYSGCLGSYGLQHSPGEFVFVAAPRLDSFIGKRRSLDQSHLFDLAYRTGTPSSLLPCYWPYVELPYVEEMFYFMYEYYSRYNVPLPWPFLGNHHFAGNIYDFSSKYLTAGIGEPIYAKTGIYNPQARSFLHDLLRASRMKARKERDAKPEESRMVLDLVTEYFRYGYANPGRSADDIPPDDAGPKLTDDDLDAGGIGIIYTIVNLGEGE